MSESECHNKTRNCCCVHLPPENNYFIFLLSFFERINYSIHLNTSNLVILIFLYLLVKLTVNLIYCKFDEVAVWYDLFNGY